jgi:hypothetical protein
MSKFTCRCGFLFSTGTGHWFDYERLLVHGCDIEKALELSGEHQDSMTEKRYAIIDERSAEVYVCPNCDRLWKVQAGGEVVSYVRET